MVVPAGQAQVEPYNSHEDVLHIADQLKVARIILVKEGEVKYPPFEQAKAELNQVIPQLLPAGCPPQTVQYYTDEAHQPPAKASLIFQGKNVLVEQLRMDEQGYRQLRLKSNPSLVVDRVRLGYCSAMKAPQNALKTDLLPMKKGVAVCIDQQYLEEGGKRTIVAILRALRLETIKVKGINALFFGSACTLPLFLAHNFEGVRATVIEGFPDMVEAAHRCFEFPVGSPSLKLAQGDATTLLSKHKPGTLHLIVMDLPARTPEEQFPPPQFLDPGYLRRLHSLLDTSGLLMVNVSQSQFESALEIFKQEGVFYPLWVAGTGPFLIVAGAEAPKVVEKSVLLSEGYLALQPPARRWEWAEDELLKAVKLVKPYDGYLGLTLIEARPVNPKLEEPKKKKRR